jgi:hypothetical protein
MDMAKRISLIIITLTVLSVITPFNTAHAEGGTTMQIAPSTSTVGGGTTFTLDVTVTDVTDLAVWEFRLFYLNTVLNCTNITEGPFLKAGGSTFFDSTILNAYNATHGGILAGSTLLGPVPGVNGTGTLATITFQTIAAGDTPLQFSNDPLVTFLSDSSPPPRHPIPFTTIDGTAHVTAENVTADHDVAVTDLTSYKTIIGQGYSGNITVTIANQGSYAETFNVTAYANTTVITAIANVTLAEGNSIVQTVVWNTTGFAYGNYTMSAYAWPVPDETNTHNNNLTSPITVMVTMPGDLVAPFGVIDMRDVAYVAKRFGTNPSNPLWNPNADINNDGTVDMRDIAMVAKNFGKHYP